MTGPCQHCVGIPSISVIHSSKCFYISNLTLEREGVCERVCERECVGDCVDDVLDLTSRVLKCLSLSSSIWGSCSRGWQRLWLDHVPCTIYWLSFITLSNVSRDGSGILNNESEWVSEWESEWVGEWESEWLVEWVRARCGNYFWLLVKCPFTVKTHWTYLMSNDRVTGIITYFSG